MMEVSPDDNFAFQVAKTAVEDIELEDWGVGKLQDKFNIPEELAYITLASAIHLSDQTNCVNRRLVPEILEMFCKSGLPSFANVFSTEMTEDVFYLDQEVADLPTHPETQTVDQDVKKLHISVKQTSINEDGIKCISTVDSTEALYLQTSRNRMAQKLQLTLRTCLACVANTQEGGLNRNSVAEVRRQLRDFCIHNTSLVNRFLLPKKISDIEDQEPMVQYLNKPDVKVASTPGDDDGDVVCYAKPIDSVLGAPVNVVLDYLVMQDDKMFKLGFYVVVPNPNQVAIIQQESGD